MPEVAAEAEVVAAAITDTTSLILVFILPIILTTTSMLTEVAAAEDKALAVMVALVERVIVLMLMVTMVITAEHQLVDQAHLTAAPVVLEHPNQDALVVQVVMADLIIMQVAMVVRDTVTLVVDLAAAAQAPAQLVPTELVEQPVQMEQKVPQVLKEMLSLVTQTLTI